jgi:hypothetical protein
VILGLDDAVGCAALAWDVAVKISSQFRLYNFWTSHGRRELLPVFREDVQVNEFTLIVLHNDRGMTVDLGV